jgi:outer membrane PBP1 activator LpoA protein
MRILVTLLVTLVAAVIAALIAGCDSKPREGPDIVKTQRQAMDKAKAVEETLQRSADERRERADQEK